MPIPIRAKNPPESFPVVTCMLILINTLVYFGTSDHGTRIRPEVMANWGLKASTFDIPRMVSSMFLHASLLHLIGNMWFLYLFGFSVEGRLRSLKFSLVYLLAGATGDLMYHLVAGKLSADVPSIGASGAIMGVVGAAMYLFPHAKVTVLYRLAGIQTTDWTIATVACYYLGCDVLWALFGVRDGVGHLAHIGGALGGLIVCAAFLPRRDNETVSEAKATLADTKDLSTLSRMELGELHRTNPNDTSILLNWALRSIREPGGMRDDCRAAFLQALPRILAEQDVSQVASVLIFVVQDPAAATPAVLLDVGARLERASNPRIANQLYESVQIHPGASDDDLQFSAFRIAMLAEASFNDAQRAWAWYQHVVQRWPMGHLAPQAKARLEVLARKAALSNSRS